MSFLNPRRLWALTPALALSLAAAPAAWAAEVLAVTASSTDGMLMDAVDGDAATFWQNKGRGERDAWLAVRFEAPTPIQGVRLKTGALPAGVSLMVETSIDGSTYQPQLQRQQLRDDQAADLRFAHPTEALYVRVRFHYEGGGQPPRFKVYELEAL